MSQSNPLENLGRLVKTLDYFEAIPIVSWMQKMFRPNLPVPQPQVTLATSGQAVVFDFTTIDNLPQTWGAVDDVVMGGVSASSLMRTIEGALFTGNVSTANSGGFASVRTRNFEAPLNLANYQGLELRVKGDGNRYKFLARSDMGWDTIAYAYAFDTQSNEWMTIRIPFSEMIPVFRAKTLQNTAPIDPSQIRSLQLMLSKFEYDGQLNPKFNPGQFQLVISSITAY